MIWLYFLVAIISLVVGLAAGFFFARTLIIRELKKNPPINANMIRAMYSQMGRKPSESQIQAVVQAMMRHK